MAFNININIAVTAKRICLHILFSFILACLLLFLYPVVFLTRKYLILLVLER